MIVSGCVNLDESVLNRCFNRKTTFLATETAINRTTDKFQIYQGVNIGIKHGFPYINVYQVPREMLKTEAGFQHLPRDLANVNVLENNV